MLLQDDIFLVTADIALLTHFFSEHICSFYKAMQHTSLVCLVFFGIDLLHFSCMFLELDNFFLYVVIWYHM